MHPLIKLLVCEDVEKYSIKNKIENQHDKLFKDLLNNKEELKSFLYDYLKIDIFKKEIEKCSNSYISGKYRIFEADIVYKIKNENTYILIEHQSSIDQRMPHRMLNYCIEVQEQEIDVEKERNKNYKYPYIIPIVLYTGTKKWKVPTEFSEKINSSDYKKKYIEMKYELVDINNYEEEELLKKNTAISYAMLIEKNRGKDSLINVLNKIVTNCKDKETSKKMQKIIKYLLYPVLGEDTEEIIRKFNVKEEFNMKTAQDYIREEIAELKRKAKAEGVAETMKTAQDYIREEMAELKRKAKAEGVAETMKTAQDYIREEMAELKRKAKAEGVAETMKTAQDYIREEMAELKRKAREEGVEEGKLNIILNMIKRKVKVEQIKEYTGVDEDMIQKIAANI